MKRGIFVNTIQCPNCGDIIYSRARHDFRSCTCGDTFIDGGFDYTRIGAKEHNKVQVKKKLIKNVTRKDLFNDWNYNGNRYGLIGGI